MYFLYTAIFMVHTEMEEYAIIRIDEYMCGAMRESTYVLYLTSFEFFHISLLILLHIIQLSCNQGIQSDCSG
jgi:hypothetical protein